MPKVVTSFNNFSRAKLDHDMNGRFNLPLYQNGADVYRNMISNFKGNAIYRTGFELREEFQDCRFIEFKFNDEQSYLLVLYNTEMKFLSYDGSGNFGFVQSGGGDLTVTTPWSLEESKDLQFAQNGDAMYLVHEDYEPRKLVRTAADAFTLSTPTLTGSPFSSGNYPACVTFYKARLWFGRGKTEVTTIWGSVVGSYEDFTVGSDDDDALELQLADIAEPIEWLFAGDNSLIVGSRDGVVAVNGGSVTEALTANNVEASLTSAEGANGTIPLKKDGLIFYVGSEGRNIYFFNYDLLSESFKARNANFISYDITQGGLSTLRWKKDRDDLIFSIRGDGAIISLNFNEEENVIGFHEHVPANGGQIVQQAVITDDNGDQESFFLILRGSTYYIESLGEYVDFSFRDSDQFFTNDEDADNEAYARKVAEELKGCIYLDNSECANNLQEDNTITYDDGAGTITANSSVFSSGDVGKRIVYKTDTGYESGMFEITAYTSGTVVEVDVIQEPTSNTYDDWYLSFDTISGLSRFNGETVSVVADGGYLDDFEVSGGEIDLGEQVTSVCVGYRYTGIIKTFSLGFVSQGANTQTTFKNVSRIGFRTVTSAGGKFGTNRYDLEAIQELNNGDYNYLPPLPLDGTIYKNLVDDNEIDKYFYFIQDLPLPFKLTSMMLEAEYAASS